MHLKHKYLHFILISLIIILLSSCSRLPKNPSSQNKTILVVKTDLINSSKYNVQTRFKFKINSKSGALDEFWLTPSGSLSIIKSLDVGSYTINGYESAPVATSSKGNQKHNMSGSFDLGYGQITILEKKISYKQEPYGSGGWKANWNIKSLSYTEKQKIISELRKDENFNKWSMYKNIASVGSGKIVDSSITEPQGWCSKENWNNTYYNPSEENLNLFISRCRDVNNEYRKEAVVKLNRLKEISKKVMLCSESKLIQAGDNDDKIEDFIEKCNTPSNRFYKTAVNKLKELQKVEPLKISVVQNDPKSINEAIILPIGILGNISETKQTIIYNKFLDVVSNDYDLISQEEYEKAEEEAFQQLDYEECTEDQCIRLIQEFLQVENLFKIQLVNDEEDIQVSLTFIDLDKKLVKTDFCEGCKTSELIGMINSLYQELQQKRRK